MSETLDSLFERIAVACDDPTQKWCREKFIRPFLNQIWEDLYAELAQYEINWPKRRVDFDLAANTSDLTSFTADGQPLQDMVEPTFVEWKIQGDADYRYRECFFRDRLPDLDPSTQGNLYYALLNHNILVTPSSVGTHLRIEFEVIAPEYFDLSDQVLAGIRNVLAFSVAADILATRGADALAARRTQQATRAMETLEVKLVKKRQRLPLRLGSQRRMRRARFLRVSL